MDRTEGLIAYKGQVTLDKAVWDNITGMTMVVDLEQRPHELTAANPFKKFTKMRKGRVGTRFSVVMMSDGDKSPAYDDEVMLKGWNDGTNGWRVTFWINADEDGLHPFMNDDKGSEFALVAGELDDDNEAIDQVKREKVETAVKRKHQGLSSYAAMLCRTPGFHKWLEEKQGLIVLSPEMGKWEDAAKVWMCQKLGIESRAELDSDAYRALMFHAEIREPYAAWMAKQ